MKAPRRVVACTRIFIAQNVMCPFTNVIFPSFFFIRHLYFSLRSKATCVCVCVCRGYYRRVGSFSERANIIADSNRPRARKSGRATNANDQRLAARATTVRRRTTRFSQRSQTSSGKWVRVCVRLASSPNAKGHPQRRYLRLNTSERKGARRGRESSVRIAAFCFRRALLGARA